MNVGSFAWVPVDSRIAYSLADSLLLLTCITDRQHYITVSLAWRDCMSECHTGVWYLHRKMELYSCFQRPFRYCFLTTRHPITKIRDTTVRNILPLKYDRISLNVRCLGSAKFSSFSTLHKPNIGPDVSRITTDRNSQSLSWKQQIAPYRKCSSFRPDQSSTILSGNVDRFDGLRINIQEQLSNNEALLNSKDVFKRSLLGKMMKGWNLNPLLFHCIVYLMYSVILCFIAIRLIIKG